jgi:hypothetical protein
MLTVFKFMAGGSGVALFFYRNDLFARLARAGATHPDAVHQLRVNNHGSFSYITLEQHNHLRLLVVASAVLVGLMIVVDIVQRRVLK